MKREEETRLLQARDGTEGKLSLAATFAKPTDAQQQMSDWNKTLHLHLTFALSAAQEKKAVLRI